MTVIPETSRQWNHPSQAYSSKTHPVSNCVGICYTMHKLVAVFVMACVSAICEGKTFLLEASKAKGEHTVNGRSGSTSGSAVHLTSGDSISLTFCLRQEFSFVMIRGVLFSNDGGKDRCSVSLDGAAMGTFASIAESDWGRLWNQFRNSGQLGKRVRLSRGIHSVKILCDSGDGIEIDGVKMEVDDRLLTQDTFGCRLQCQAVSALKRPARSSLYTYTKKATAAQRSYPTKCAEEDNVHIPMYMENIANYTITATLPTYASYVNRRNRDEAECHFLPPVHWTFNNFSMLPRGRKLSASGAQLTFVGGEWNTKKSKGVEVTFKLDGPSKGHLDSEIGSFMVLKIRPVTFSLLISVNYNGRHGYRTNVERKYLLPGQRELVWNFPDFTWDEYKGNTVTVTFSAVFSINLVIEELRMERRYMKPERSFSIYKSDDVIIEGVDIDFWWREPEKMTAQRIDNGEKWEDVDYFRILRPVPWAEGYAQVFVLYQDGNARLLQLPPSGLDWIPFGSSVIIGPTDPRIFRPSSPISHVDFSPQKMKMDLYFRDGGSANLHLKSEADRSTLTVSKIKFKKSEFLPFATFRSMYVEDGNSDCDRIMVDDSEVYNIMDPWRAKLGRSFTFFRECESKHLTLSPDIRVDITGLYN